MLGFQQGPPVFNPNIPIEAQGLIAQPEAVKMLRQVNGFDLLSLLYFQMPFMLLPKDAQRLEKVGQKFVTTGVLGLVAGIFLNVQVKRISMNFLKLPMLVKLPIRLAIMTIPFAILSPQIKAAGEEVQSIMDRVENKKNRLTRNLDLEEYF